MVLLATVAVPSQWRVLLWVQGLLVRVCQVWILGRGYCLVPTTAKLCDRVREHRLRQIQAAVTPPGLTGCNVPLDSSNQAQSPEMRRILIDFSLLVFPGGVPQRWRKTSEMESKFTDDDDGFDLTPGAKCSSVKVHPQLKWSAGADNQAKKDQSTQPRLTQTDQS